eukprot:15360859-Ditylum_brightwellii.AAC.1
MFQQDYEVHLDKNAQLHHFMKAVSKDYIPPKSGIITTIKELACKVYTTLVYLGLPQNSKALKIQDTDVAHNKQTMKWNIDFWYASKHPKKGFSFYIPKYMHTLLDKFKQQPADHERFLRNWSPKDD